MGFFIANLSWFDLTRDQYLLLHLNISFFSTLERACHTHLKLIFCIHRGVESVIKLRQLCITESGMLCLTYDLNFKCVWKSMHNYEAVAGKVIFICGQAAAWLSLRQAPIYSTYINFTVIRDSLIHPKQNYKIKIIAMDIFITEWFAVIHCFCFGGILCTRWILCMFDSADLIK